MKDEHNAATEKLKILTPEIEFTLRPDGEKSNRNRAFGNKQE